LIQINQFSTAAISMVQSANFFSIWSWWCYITTKGSCVY